MLQRGEGHGRNVLVASLLVNKTPVKVSTTLPPHQTTPNSQGFPTALTVISAHIEGFTAVKASMLSVMRKDKKLIETKGDHGRSVLVEIPARLEDNVK